MKVKKLILNSLATLALLLLPAAVFSESAIAAGTDTAKNAVCSGLGAVTGSDGCDENPDEANVDDTISTVINILSLITAVIAVIMIIVGGIRYVTSSGDSGSTSSARNTIIYAVVGLVIVALAQLIVKFVVQRVTDSGS